MTKCRVRGCGREVHGLGLCKMHNQRLRRSGSIGPAQLLKAKTLYGARMQPSVLCSSCGRPGVFGTYYDNGKLHYKRRCNSCLSQQEVARRAKNPQKYRKYNREYQRKFRRGYFKAHPEKRPFSKPWARLNIEKYLFMTMQRRAPVRRRKGKKNDPRYALKLTFQEFLAEIGGKAPAHCPILGVELRISDDPRADCLPTIDRIDNDRSYEKGNIAIISRRANILKNGGTAEEHRRIADWMDATASRPSKLAA